MDHEADFGLMAMIGEEIIDVDGYGCGFKGGRGMKKFMASFVTIRAPHFIAE